MICPNLGVSWGVRPEVCGLWLDRALWSGCCTEFPDLLLHFGAAEFESKEKVVRAPIHTGSVSGMYSFDICLDPRGATEVFQNMSLGCGIPRNVPAIR